MKRIYCKIEGKTPLLCNRFTDEAALSATRGNRASMASGESDSPREQVGKFTR